MHSKVNNDTCGCEDIAAFSYPAKGRTPPTRRKLAAFVNSSMNKCSSKFGAAIKRVAGLFPDKKAKSKSKGLQRVQGELPVPIEVANVEPTQPWSEASPVSSVSSSQGEINQDQGTPEETAGAVDRLVNAFHLDDELDGEEADLDELESVSAQEHRLSTPTVPIAFASGRYAAFPWPSPLAVSCFNHQRLNSDLGMESAEHAPVSSITESYDPRPVLVQGNSPSEAANTPVSDAQVTFFSRRPPSGEQSRQEVQSYIAASIKMPPLKPFRLKTSPRGSISRPVSEYGRPLPEHRAETVNFTVPGPMPAIIEESSDNSYKAAFATSDSLLEEEELAEGTGCSLAFWSGILGQASTTAFLPELQPSPVRTVEVVHFAVPEPMSAVIVDVATTAPASVSKPTEPTALCSTCRGHRLGQADIERRITERARSLARSRGKRSSMIEWLELIQSDDNACSPPSSPESSLPTTPSSAFSPLPDFGDAFEGGLKAIHDAAFDAGGDLLSL